MRPAGSAGRPPGDEVGRAYGVAAAPVLLDGGQRRTWRAGDVVLKPVDDLPEQHEWLCEVYDAWPASDVVRVPQPLRAEDGAWSAHGWAAHRWVEGETVRAGDDPAAFRCTVEAFHDAVGGLPRPAFLDVRDDAWSFGDRVAWEDLTPEGPAEIVDLLADAIAALEPVTEPAQVIHGDVAGNVLRAGGLPDAVIDWPPYHRPRGFSLAVAAGDAVCWEGADPSILDAWADVPDWDQLLLRAVIFRIATRGRNEALGVTPAGSDGYVDARRPSVDLVLHRLGRG
jgi:uncharacterized protein (TIGR02569 family)